MNKSIYAISGYIPSDEDIISISIYKLIKYGKDDIRYAWIMINGMEGNGIGTQTNEFGEKEKEDALIKIHGYVDEKYRIVKCTFDEAITHYQELKNVLEKQLSDVLQSRSETVA